MRRFPEWFLWMGAIWLFATLGLLVTRVMP